MDFEFLLRVFTELLAAVPTTLALFVASTSLGALFALGLTAMRASHNRFLNGFARAYVFVFRGSPLLVQLFLIYYGLGQFSIVRSSFVWPVLRDAFACAVLALALCTAAYQAEIMRGGLLAVPEGEVDAARSIGMSGFLLLRRIVAPIAVRHALPAYSTEIVLMVKSTALASLVTVWEITGVAQRLITQTYRTMEVFLVAVTIYLLINLVVIKLLGLLETYLSPHLRDRPTLAPATATPTTGTI